MCLSIFLQLDSTMLSCQRSTNNQHGSSDMDCLSC